MRATWITYEVNKHLFGGDPVERPITANGTDTFYVVPGRYILTFVGTPAVGTTVNLLGSNGVQVTDQDGDDVEITGGAIPESCEIACAGDMSLVTASYAGSTGLSAQFRRLPS